MGMSAQDQWKNFNPELESALAKVIQSDDPLDQANFDPVAFLNEKFPDERSLSGVPDYSRSLEQRIGELDDDIFQAVREQAVAGKQVAQDIADCKEAIKGLCRKIQDIKSKAEESEVMVKEICQDIRQLDTAKRHLTTTITALKRLQMFVTCINSLRTMTLNEEYKGADNLVSVLTSLSEHFNEYANIPKIQELHKSVYQIKATLKERLFKDFSHMGLLGAPQSTFEDDPLVLDKLKNGCTVITSMGDQMKEQLIMSFLEDQLRPFRRKLKNAPTGLDGLNKWYKYIRQVIRDYDSHCSLIFPGDWLMDRILTTHFCQEMAQRVNKMLESMNAGADVKLLIKALNEAQVFQSFLVKRFPDMPDEPEEKDSSSASAATNPFGGASTDGAPVAKADRSRFPSFRAIISSVFEPYLTHYVEARKKNLDDMVDKLTAEDNALNVKKNSLRKFNSSIQLFHIIKDGIEHCATRVSTGQTLYAYHKKLKESLKYYASTIQKKLPKGRHTTTHGGHGTEYYTFSKDPKERDAALFLINTCEYCADTVPKVESMIRGTIDKAYKQHIDMEAEVDMFEELLATGIKVVVSDTVHQMEGPLSKMAKKNWGNLTSVGDQSAYVVQINHLLQGSIPRVRAVLSEVYFENFCDQMAAKFLPKFINTIYKCKRINEVEGVQQLRIDLVSLKNLMLGVPQMGGSDDGSANDDCMHLDYKRFVNKEISKAEVLLKLISTPRAHIVDMFRVMMKDAGAEELVQVLMLKGIKKREREEIVASAGLQYTQAQSGSRRDVVRNAVDQTASQIAEIFRFGAR